MKKITNYINGSMIEPSSGNYFENIDLSGVDSAYRFSWLSSDQAIVLQNVFEYISKEYQIPTHEAQKALRTLRQVAA